MRTWINVTIGVVLILALAVGIYFGFYYKATCNNYECFSNKMKACDSAVYRNEAPEATWFYQIQGKSGDVCQVYVKMLNAKKGENGVDKIVGYDMVCDYPLGVAIYPEKDINVCHGRLKEELQGIIISKLHSYLIENLGKVDEALKQAI